MKRFEKIPPNLIIAGLFLLLVFSGPGFTGTVAGEEYLPERVVLNLTQTPHLSQAVTWRSREKGGTPAAQIVPVSRLLDSQSHAVTVNADTCRVKTGEQRVAYHHSVVFESLLPDTEYAYRVGDAPHWSEWCRFKTASDRKHPFRFVFFGDVQEQVASLGSQLFRTAVLAVPDAAFWLFAGDMMDNGPDDREWAGFFDAVSWMPKTFPMVPVPGNHEYPDPRIIPRNERRITPLWRPHFTLPDNGPPGLEETVYSMVYQGVCLIVLNGNEPMDAQAAWLEAILSRKTAEWTIVAIHQTVYPISTRRHVTKFQEILVPIFDRYAVDLVLQGHDHGYARTMALKNHQPVTGNEKGTVYIISNSGPKFYPVSDRYDHLMARTGSREMLFHSIEVDQNTLRFTAFDLLRQPVDEVVIHKTMP
ncbi:MAG: metallophosphoesterase family protein [Desulfotignum sp.]|nr:metallophosphoesterase family protein [Desulfotignum sp.]